MICPDPTCTATMPHLHIGTSAALPCPDWPRACTSISDKCVAPRPEYRAHIPDVDWPTMALPGVVIPRRSARLRLRSPRMMRPRRTRQIARDRRIARARELATLWAGLPDLT